jgi:hypothetical protein
MGRGIIKMTLAYFVFDPIAALHETQAFGKVLTFDSPETVYMNADMLKRMDSVFMVPGTYEDRE